MARSAGPDNVTAGFRNRYLDHMMNIWAPDNIRDSTAGIDNFSWLRFADVSPQEAYEATQYDAFAAAEVARGRSVIGLYPATEASRAEFARWRRAS